MFVKLDFLVLEGRVKFIGVSCMEVDIGVNKKNNVLVIRVVK